ncbi:MAG: PD-(D/E)XK nuclease family protein [Planctomycetes bacterium]|nr:PD-(D/E)XK nuclease family protein [Planctomycetota bacterium]
MSISRVFLDWRRPPLESAADYLLGRYRRGAQAAMRGAIVITPVVSGGRRLLEILLERAETEGLRLDPPDIDTVGNLPEKLYRPKFPFASQLVQQLAWTRVLRDSPPERLAAIVANPPEPDDATGWMNLGELLRRQHVELAGDALDFADVLRLGPEVEGFRETDRWQAMRAVQAEYLKLLDRLEVWDLQTARLVAIKQREFQTERDIIVIGAVDLSIAARRILDQVADRVTALVHAPEEWGDRFDEHGCVIPEKWLDAPIDVRDVQVVRVAGPDDQAEAVALQLAGYDGRYAADEVTIGVPDPLLAPHIERQLYQSDVQTHYYDGGRVLDSAPCRLLSAIAGYLERGRFVDFAALARHPDLHEWLVLQTGDSSLLTQLDELYCNRLPARLDDDEAGGWHEYPAAAEAFTVVAALLAPLREGQRRLPEWTQPLTQLLTEVYRGREFDRDDPPQANTVLACARLERVLSEHETLPDELSPQLSAADAIRYSLEQLTGEMLPAPQKPEAVELLGWLDLPLDDAPAVVITSFNEGRVPSSISADMFLPNELRRRLGVVDNERRYARDAYALSSILASREDVTLIVARHDAEGNPLPPSRLLFAADEHTIAQRARRFFAPLAPKVRPHPLVIAEEPFTLRADPPQGRRRRGKATSAPTRPRTFEVPRPTRLVEPIKHMSVTSFKEYIACPYRFYLKRVLKLDSLDDAAAEMDAGVFGTLLHDVLDEFGRDEQAREWKDAEKILAMLKTILDGMVRERHGLHPLPAVRVQVEQIRYRLQTFADWQAEWVRKGWRIRHTETADFREPPFLDVDGEPMLLKARIDRILFGAASSAT